MKPSPTTLFLYSGLIGPAILAMVAAGTIFFTTITHMPEHARLSLVAAIAFWVKQVRVLELALGWEAERAFIDYGCLPSGRYLTRNG